LRIHGDPFCGPRLERLMEMISKAIVWYPDRSVKLARMYRCGECGTDIVTYASETPLPANGFIDGKAEHRHMVVRRQHLGTIHTADLCRCLEHAGDDPECPIHGVKEIQVIFKD
jgi:hypothetical protein